MTNTVYSDHAALLAEANARADAAEADRDEAQAERYRAAVLADKCEWEARDASSRAEAAAAKLAERDAGWLPKVKALEWTRERPTDWIPETWKAQSLAGEYDIQSDKDGTFSGFAPNAGTDIFHTVDDAKAAAQADFERRILSALVPPQPSIEEQGA